MRGWQWVDLDEIAGMAYGMEPLTLLKLFIGGKFGGRLGAPVMITPLRGPSGSWITHILRPAMEIVIPETVATFQPWSPETLNGEISWMNRFRFRRPPIARSPVGFFFNDYKMKEEHPVMVPRRWGLTVLKNLRHRTLEEIADAAERIDPAFRPLG